MGWSMGGCGSSFTGITKLLLPGQSTAVGCRSIGNDIALPVVWLNIALPVVWLVCLSPFGVACVCLSPFGVACVSKSVNHSVATTGWKLPTSNTLALYTNLKQVRGISDSSKCILLQMLTPQGTILLKMQVLLLLWLYLTSWSSKQFASAYLIHFWISAFLFFKLKWQKPTINNSDTTYCLRWLSKTAHKRNKIWLLKTAHKQNNLYMYGNVTW